ncbi:MAG: hypothetical protein GEV07_12680 [Streptosporangiales bacterium]|nr:hypothetical protein [Streptosporangiales bacterium]
MRVWSRRPRHRARAGEQEATDRWWSIPESAQQPPGNWRLVVSWRDHEGTPRFRYLSQTMSGVPQRLLAGYHVPDGLAVEPAVPLPDQGWQLGALWQGRDQHGSPQWRITHISGRFDGDPRYFVYGYRQPGHDLSPAEADRWAQHARHRQEQAAVRANEHQPTAQVPRGRWDVLRGARGRGRHRGDRRTVGQFARRNWARVKDRVRRGESKEPKPVQRLYGYEISKYLLLDAVSMGRTAAVGAAVLSGFQAGGVGLAVAAGVAVWVTTATTRGALSATVTKLRERGDKRWEDRQESKHERSLRADVAQDKQIQQLSAGYEKLRDDVAQLRADVARGGGQPPRSAPSTRPVAAGLRSDGWPAEERTDNPAPRRGGARATVAGPRGTSRRAAPSAPSQPGRGTGRPGAERAEPPRSRF